LFRVFPDGTLQSAPLAYEGCLSLSPYTDTGSCSKLVKILPLSGDEVVFIARRDESQTEDQSRWVFDLRRSNAPFVTFQPSLR
jgi:hypothetical protein